MIRPLRGYVLILPDKAEEKTASGLYVHDKAQEKPQKGTIVSIGDKTLEMLRTIGELGSQNAYKICKERMSHQAAYGQLLDILA